ncbi:TPM domain-containing protein [Waterburya agarophytonicola K14]|uniref:TPM domain-containing protein n=1 Tax=Waterburya agarophytonicola KI4 TaxID=2874699 RepID=A0A964BPR6_9CYAN|nr:TPM domain-containing protein [Waterburya agarophytonicola]MCC0176243.1 TPM domain-containing protein [Waterburya agarophytonicola KI4]
MKQYLMLMKQWGSRLKSLIVTTLLVVFTLSCIAASVISFATPSAIATGLFDLPNFDADQIWVVDTADAISSANQSKLSKTFKDLADETGQEVRMVAIRRLDYGETVDTLADEIFKDWYSNPEIQANQTLIVLDTLTNNAAIRTGDAAKGMVSTEIAESIIDDTVGYNIRKGNKYNQAFLDAGDRLVAVLSGQEDPGPPIMEDDIQIEGTFTKAEDTDDSSATIWVIGFLIVATVIPMATYYWYVGFGS